MVAWNASPEDSSPSRRTLANSLPPSPCTARASKASGRSSALTTSPVHPPLPASRCPVWCGALTFTREGAHSRNGCPAHARAIPPDTKSRDSQRCIADDLMDAAKVTARCHVIKCDQWSGTQPANEPGLPFYLFGDHGPTAGYGIPLPIALSTRQLLPYGRWKLHLEVWASELLAWCYRHSAVDPDLLT